MTAKSKAPDTSDREIVLTREFNAPLSLLWAAWTEPERLARWWGPKDHRLEVLCADIRPGGAFHYAMVRDGAEPMYGLSEFRELEAPRRIVWVNSFADREGNVARAPFSALFPLKVLSTARLEARGERSVVQFRAAPSMPPPRSAGSSATCSLA
jgi:uncharacterized protein YndB with AHSA1/START domain